MGGRNYVNYDRIYERLKQGEVTTKELMELTGLSNSSVSQVITTLSLSYPVWSPKKGVYKLIERKDFE